MVIQRPFYSYQVYFIRGRAVSGPIQTQWRSEKSLPLLGLESCKISSAGPVFRGTKWLLWRPHTQSPTLHCRCGINKGLIKRSSTINHWRLRCKGWILWLTPCTYIHTYILGLEHWSSIPQPVITWLNFQSVSICLYITVQLYKNLLSVSAFILIYCSHMYHCCRYKPCRINRAKDITLRFFRYISLHINSKETHIKKMYIYENGVYCKLFNKCCNFEKLDLVCTCTKRN
jgi:hypothetical protein